ncbi:MAG: O-antigen ligase family protein [Nitrospirota bacterium]
MKNRIYSIDRIIEVGIYLYIIFMFLSKGESIRNILLFTIFFLWLLTFKERKNKNILTDSISLFFGAFIISIVISSIFSIDKWYSISELQKDPLKSVLLFPVISTTLTNEKKLIRLTYVFFVVLLLTLSVSYYSYWALNLPIMKPDIPLMHQWHNRFAIFLNTLMPFSFILLLYNKRLINKVGIAAALAAGIVALALSTSRGGIASFLLMFIIWAIYFLKKKKVSVKPILGAFAVAIIILGVAAFYAKPEIKDRFLDIKNDIKTLNYRTVIWKPLIYAAKEKPILGWGYGTEIFRSDEPFKKTPFKVSPVKMGHGFRRPDSIFMSILFHQGITGLILYLLLLIVAIKTFWEEAFSTQRLQSYILIACTSVLISTYGLHSMIENTRLFYLTLILGVGLAAKNCKNEDSHS